MSLTFGAVSTDRVDIGSATLTGSTMTIMAWINVTTLTSTRAIYGSRQGASSAVVQFRLSGTTGNLQIQLNRTSNTSYITNDTPLATTGSWRFVCVTFDTSASPVAHIYTGSLTSIAVESTYGTSTAGSGALETEASGGNTWANRNVGGFSAALQGQIAWGQIYNRVLTLGEIKSLQFAPSRISGCLAYHQFGFAGTSTQPDWSGNGNAGTVTGATQSAHVPLGAPFRGAPNNPYIVSGGVTVPPMDSWFNPLNLPQRERLSVVGY